MLLKLPPVALSPTRMLMRGVYAQRSCLFDCSSREGEGFAAPPNVQSTSFKCKTHKFCQHYGLTLCRFPADELC